MTVLVGVPNRGEIKTDTVISLLQICANNNVPSGFRLPRSTILPQSRTEICEFAQNNKCDHILFLDSDVAIESKGLQKLLAHRKEVVGAAVSEMMVFPQVKNVRQLNNNGEWEYAEMQKQLFKCDGIGTGCLLIATSVLDAIDTPWFTYEYRENGTIKSGEDLWFCKQCKKAGIQVWCDPTVNVSHVGDFKY